MTRAQQRFLFCQYADDVRSEQDGKLLVVGMYQGGMKIAAAAPALVAKLSVLAYLNSPIDKPFKEVALRLLWNDTVLQEVRIPPGQLEAAQRNIDAEKKAKMEGVLLSFIMGLQPFHVPASGKLRVEVDTEDGTLRGNGLLVTLEPPPASTTDFSPLPGG